MTLWDVLQYEDSQCVLLLGGKTSLFAILMGARLGMYRPTLACTC